MAETVRKGVIHPVAKSKEGHVRGVFIEKDERGAPIGSATLEMRPVAEGEPVGPGHIRTEWDEGNGHYKATIHGEPPVEPGGSGPPKVNSKAFQSGWDRIWGGGPEGEA